MFWYGHPLVNQGAGRIKTDNINEQRIETVLNRFEEWANERGQLKNLKYSVSKSQLKKSQVAFPIAGFAFGLLASYTFVHPNSRYIGKFFTLLTTSIGYYVHLHYVHAYNVSRRIGNLHQYPTDIQRMLDNNDSRYAFKWLGDSWKEIGNVPAISTVQTTQTEQ